MNFAENQAKRDRGELSLADCRRLGETHRAYGWAPDPAADPDGRWGWSAAQKAAYHEGFAASEKEAPK